MKKIDRKIFLRVRANNKVIIICRDVYVPPEKRMYDYYVKGTTLRTRYNMIPEDFFNTKKGWIGCNTRNQAKRLIASNRKLLKIINKLADYAYLTKNVKLVCTHKYGILYIPEEKQNEKEITKS